MYFFLGGGGLVVGMFYHFHLCYFKMMDLVAFTKHSTQCIILKVYVSCLDVVFQQILHKLHKWGGSVI